MKNGRMAFATLVILILASGHGLAETAKDVNVVNTPTVQSQQSGDWSVNIDKTREPFQRSVVFTTPAGFSQFFGEFTVPEGKRLVIEQVSAISLPPSGQIVRNYVLITTVDGALAFHTIPSTFNGFADFVGCQQVRVYADGGTLVKLGAARDTSTGSYETVGAVSGYLIPMP
jgi:hypothetical protein